MKLIKLRLRYPGEKIIIGEKKDTSLGEWKNFQDEMYKVAKISFHMQVSIALPQSYIPG